MRHPHIANVFDFIEQNGAFYEVIEYLPGGTLAEVLGNGAPPLPLVFTWTKHVLSALSYAHDQGVIHRDIKPSNLMLDQQGNVKLTDFGIALVLGDKRITVTGKSFGTPEYMSPEQIASPRDVDRRSDIYSLGVVLFELLTGQVPFKGDSEFKVYQSHVNDRPPSLRSFSSSVPDELERVVLTALEKKPAERYQDCQEMLRAIEQCEGRLSFSRIPLTRIAAKAPADRGQLHSEVVSLGSFHRPKAFAAAVNSPRGFLKMIGVTAVVLSMLGLIAVLLYRTWGSPFKVQSERATTAVSLSRRFSERLLYTVDHRLDLQKIFPEFSASGVFVAYKAVESKEEVVEVKGKQGRYGFVESKKEYMVVNGKRGPTFDFVSSPSFSADGNRIGYYAELGKKWFVLVDNSIVA